MKIFLCFVESVIDLIIHFAWSLKSKIYLNIGNATFVSNVNNVALGNISMKTILKMDFILQLMIINYQKILVYAMIVVKMNIRNKIVVFVLKKQLLIWIIILKFWNAENVVIIVIFNVQELLSKNCKHFFKNTKKKLKNSKKENLFKIDKDFQFKKFTNV